MKALIQLFILNVLLFSCTSKNTENEQKKNEDLKETKPKMEKIKIIDSLIKKYNITYSWDTLHYLYSINYKPVINSGFQLIDDPFISDIYEIKDSTYATVMTSLFYFDFPISNEQKNILTNQENDLILIVNVAELKRIKIDIESKSHDLENSDVDIGISFKYIGKGKIIDIISLKKDSL